MKRRFEKIEFTLTRNIFDLRDEKIVNAYRKVSPIHKVLKKHLGRVYHLLKYPIAEELEDDHSLGAFRTIVDKISEQQIRIFLSIIKDTHLSRKIKKNRGAMFISLAKDYAGKNNINLNFR